MSIYILQYTYIYIYITVYIHILQYIYNVGSRCKFSECIFFGPQQRVQQLYLSHLITNTGLKRCPDHTGHHNL